MEYSLSDKELPDSTNNLYDDPLFVNPEENDFSLNYDSPCIDAGDPQNPLDPDNIISDMGAYYYNSDTSTIFENELLSITAYPNPFREKFYITYQLKSENTISLTLFDIVGRTIYSIANKLQTPGYLSIMIDVFEIDYIGPVVCKFSAEGNSKEFVMLVLH